MNSLLQELDRILADPLATGRRHAASGQRVIGVASGDVPVELITAAGAFALALPYATGKTPRADEYLEPTFSPAARSLTEQWLSGHFDFMDAIVFPRSNDSLQRAYYYMCELQRRGLVRGPRPLLYDVAKIPRNTSIAHTRAATQRLAGELQTDSVLLPEAIAGRNRRRRLMNALLRQRRAPQAPPSGQLAERIMRAADLSDASSFDAALEQWLATTLPPWHGPRLLLAGSQPPDDRLHFAAELAGGRIVEEFGDHGGDRLGEEISTMGDPLEAIADHHAMLRAGARGFENRAVMLAERVRAARVGGVVLWIIEEDESIVWDVPAMKRALIGENVPLLELTRRAWDEQEAGKNAISQFVAQLGSRS